MKYSTLSTDANYTAPIQNATVQAVMGIAANAKTSMIPSKHQVLCGDDNGRLTGEELLLTPPFVYGFSFEKKIWGKPSN